MCVPIIIEKGKLGERSCIAFPVSIRPGAQCQTERRHGSYLEPRARKSYTLVFLLNPRFSLLSVQEICLPYCIADANLMVRDILPISNHP